MSTLRTIKSHSLSFKGGKENLLPCASLAKENVLTFMQDIHKQVALNLPMPVNIHFFKHPANMYTIRNQESIESGPQLFNMNLHIPRTCPSELPRNAVTKSILMKDCESNLYYFSLHYSSLLFLEPAKFCHLFQRD